MSTSELMQVQDINHVAKAAHCEPASGLVVEQSEGTGALETATAVTDEAVSVSSVQVPTPEENLDAVDNGPLPELPPSPSPSPSTTPPTLISTPSQSQVEALKLRPSPKEVISGIAPHVFDERRRRPQRVRRTSTSSSRRGYGGGHGRPPRPRAAPSPSSSQPNLRQSNSNAASMRRYGGSPLRFSASFTLEDLPRLKVEVQADFVQVGQSPMLIESVPHYVLISVQNPTFHIADPKDHDNRARTTPTKSKPWKPRKIPIPPLPILLPTLPHSPSSTEEGLKETRTKLSTRRWKTLGIRIDVQLFKTIATKLK
ncbi:hypothetical protein PQX77_011245 [Marasmius sp. AFHP31]|nr:hypothetical protein PQX77_011245 [Marasmius sp. AFHP31]